MDQWLWDQENQHEEDLDMLQDDVRNKEIQLQSLQSKFEHDSELAGQKIVSLEEGLKESKA